MASVAGIVSSGVPAPVVKSLDDAFALQAAASSARSSVTVTVPSRPEMVVPGAPEPRFADVGAVIVSAPEVTVNVTVVSGSPPAEMGPVDVGVAAGDAAGALADAGGVAGGDVAHRCAPHRCAAKLDVAADAAAGVSAKATTAAPPRARCNDFRIKFPPNKGRVGARVFPRGRYPPIDCSSEAVTQRTQI